MLFPVTTGLGSLDIVDKFVNVLGIVLIAVISTVTIGWVLKRTPELRSHVNAVSSLQLGRWWDFSLTVITPLILGITFILEVRLLLIEGYGGYASHKVVIFGWILGLVLYLGAFGLSRIPWPRGTIVDGPPAGDFGVPLTGKGAPFGQHLVDPQADAEHMQLKPEFAKES